MKSGSSETFGWSPDELRTVGADDFRDLYLSQAVLDHEIKHLFGTSWSLIATDDDFSEIGAYATFQIANAFVIVVRGRDLVLRAFHNICRHRGITLAEGSGIQGRFFTCPYHQWSFGLDGQLVNVPQKKEQFPDLNCDEYGLIPVSLEVFHGLVFVNLDNGTASLTESMEGLADHLYAFLDGPLVEIAKREYVASCNWKFIVENHVDVYHLWYLHSKTLREYNHTKMVWKNLGRNWWSLDPLREFRANSDALDWISQSQKDSLGAHLLFPNLMIITSSNYFATYDAVPIAPNETRLTLRIRAVKDADATEIMTSIDSFLSEDLFVGERLQRACTAPAFSLGPLAVDHEAPVRHLHACLRKELLK